MLKHNFLHCLQLARDGNSEVLSTALARLGEHGRRRINNLDGDKLAPLHYAARYAHTDTIKTLIHAGAEVNIRGQDRLTPLHYAARSVTLIYILKSVRDRNIYLSCAFI